MTQSFYDRVAGELNDIDAQGLTKPERVIASRQGPVIQVAGREVLNFCANNYLGLAGDDRVTQAGIAAQQKWGAGTASVRFICGTLEIHKELEAAIAGYLGFEDAILFAAAFDANGGLFEPLLGEGDAIVSDSLNHASIIDGVRLCKAKRYRFANSDMNELESRLKEARAAGARDIIIDQHDQIWLPMRKGMGTSLHRFDPATKKSFKVEGGTGGGGAVGEEDGVRDLRSVPARTPPKGMRSTIGIACAARTKPRSLPSAPGIARTPNASAVGPMPLPRFDTTRASSRRRKRPLAQRCRRSEDTPAPVDPAAAGKRMRLPTCPGRPAPGGRCQIDMPPSMAKSAPVT